MRDRPLESRASVAAALVLSLLTAVARAAEAAPAPPTAEVLRERWAQLDVEKALREAFEKMCAEDGRQWDDVKRECGYLMRAKD